MDASKNKKIVKDETAAEASFLGKIPPFLRTHLAYIAIIFLVSFSLKIIPAIIAMPLSPDACIYLDLGKNIFSGKGFYISYNIYQYWLVPLFYPALALKSTLYSIIMGFFLWLFKSITAVYIINVLIQSFNVILIYFILLHIFKTRLTAFISALLIAISYPMYFTAIYPWTEQSNLLFILISVLILVSSDKLHLNRKMSFFIIGILMGLATLIREANVYCILAFFLIIFSLWGFKKESLFMALSLCFGVLLILGPFELFCYSKYKVLYPEQGAISKNFGLAVLYGGHYSPSKPVLKPDVIFSDSEVFNLFILNFFAKLKGFILQLHKYLLFLIWLIPVGIFLCFSSRKNNNAEKTLFLLGLINLLAYALTFWWDSSIEYERYSLIPAVCFLPLGLNTFFNIEDFLKNEYHKYFRILSGIAVIFLLAVGFYDMLKIDINYIANKENYKHTAELKESMFGLLRKLTPDSGLILTSELGYTFGLDRPVVSLPLGKMDTEKNIKDLLNIYKPELIWIHKRYLSIYKGYLDKFAEEIEIPENLKLIYGVYKPKNYQQ